MRDLYKKIYLAATQLHPSVFIFILACLNFLRYDILSNEEMYLPLAKQWWDQEWMPQYFYLNDIPANRIFFQLFAGPALQYFSFDIVAYLGKVICFAGLAWPLGLLLKKWQWNYVQVFVLFQLLYFTHQTFFVGE